MVIERLSYAGEQVCSPEGSYLLWVGDQVANPNSFFYTITDPDFKYSQIWRISLGYDRKFGSGWIGTVDLLYAKHLQAQVDNNYGLRYIF